MAVLVLSSGYKALASQEESVCLRTALTSDIFLKSTYDFDSNTVSFLAEGDWLTEYAY